MDEKLIVKSILDGDRRAFEELVLKFQNKILNLAFWYVKNYDDALEISQETFIRFYNSLQNFKGESTISTYLHKITVNLCLDFIKKNKKIRYESSHKQSDKNEEYEVEIESNENLEEDYIKKEQIQILRSIIDIMPEKYKTVILLRDVRDLTYQDIATILNCKEGTVKSRINRGREWIKQYAAAKYPDTFDFETL